jgi:hypothetical protein
MLVRKGSLNGSYNRLNFAASCRRNTIMTSIVIGTVRIEPVAMSFILRVYEVLASHSAAVRHV